MADAIGDVETVQGRWIRRLLSMKAGGPIVLKSYRKAQEFAAARAGGRIHDGAGGPVALEINHGRWVASCRECRAGMSTGKGWPEIRCFECGAVYAAAWPEHLEVIERLILQRPERFRHWLPGESPGVIVGENLSRGIGRVRA
jgi:hypothetical protein